MNYSEYLPAHEGVYAFFHNANSRYICYEEINQYGFFYHREDMGNTKNEGEHTAHFSYLYEILRQIDLFLESMAIFYKELGYWGFIEIKITLNKISGVSFHDLPAPRGFTKYENISKSPIDDSLEFVRSISYQEIKDERVTLTASLMEEISWALGFSDINQEQVIKIMKDENRTS
jgi:hypothetical protein